MFCSQCTTELPAKATTCSECGSSISQDQLTTFSYLPSGAPPWPRSIAEKIPYSVVEARASEPMTSVVKPKRKVRARASSLALRIISIVLILLLTPALGILATLGVLTMQGKFSPSQISLSSLSHLPSASNTANPFVPNGASNTLPPPTAFTSASETSMKIAVQYPANWAAGPADQSTDPMQFPITQPNQQIRIYIARFSSSASSQISGPDQLNTQLVGLMSQSFTKVTVVASPNAAPAIGNDQWTEQDATYTDQNKVRNHFTTITVLHGRQNYYNINFIVPQKLYSQAMKEYIQPILNSFKFTA